MRNVLCDFFVYPQARKMEDLDDRLTVYNDRSLAYLALCVGVPAYSAGASFQLGKSKQEGLVLCLGDMRALYLHYSPL